MKLYQAKVGVLILAAAAAGFSVPEAANANAAVGVAVAGAAMGGAYRGSRMSAEKRAAYNEALTLLLENPASTPTIKLDALDDIGVEYRPGVIAGCQAKVADGRVLTRDNIHQDELTKFGDCIDGGREALKLANLVTIAGVRDPERAVALGLDKDAADRLASCRANMVKDPLNINFDAARNIVYCAESGARFDRTKMPAGIVLASATLLLVGLTAVGSRSAKPRP